MLQEVHGHIVSELHQNAKTDTVLVVTAVVFNLVVLAINCSLAAVAAAASALQANLIFGLLIIATVLINTFASRALLTGRAARLKLISGLVAIYKDNDVDKYYDASLLVLYGKRYKFFFGVIFSLATVAIVVPLLVWSLD